jgi:plasmid maintenance system antidote protein VapI
MALATQALSSHPARGYMATHGVRSKALAAETGIHPSDLSRILAGKQTATPGVRRRVSAALGQPEWLLFTPDLPCS